MTHTLHRRGTRKSLAGDYVVLSLAARGINMEIAGPRLRRMLEICAKYNPVNMGSLTAETEPCTAMNVPIKEIINRTTEKSVIHAVYADKEKVKKVLKELKDADLGISIVVTGIFDEIFKMCKDLSIKGPFTVNMSLGIMGKTERLPDDKTLEITTMCGHGQVATNLSKKLVEDVKKGKVTPEAAAKELAKQCVCGVFNTERAADLLRNLARAK